ncbi:hypothetical protein [Vibrio sp. D431a]|uniref:hypothetical protein n=1 Tax=Vibrio sp. D431a TaxID=2837388 RepID=UPI002556D8CE|nr:hypothetical protein [Vibrio sp. D431a]MDK9789994.1 hypothetical protein [Vibrio sp. D431a]
MKSNFLKITIVLGLSSLMYGCGSDEATSSNALPKFQQTQIDSFNKVSAQFENVDKVGIPEEGRKIAASFNDNYGNAASHFDKNLLEVKSGISANISELKGQHENDEALYEEKCKVGQSWTDDACNNLGEGVVELSNLIKKRESDLKNMEGKIGAEKKNALSKIYVDHINKFKTLASKNNIDIDFGE